MVGVIVMVGVAAMVGASRPAGVVLFRANTLAGVTIYGCHVYKGWYS